METYNIMIIYIFKLLVLRAEGLRRMACIN